MFFDLAKTHNTRFPVQHQLGNLVLNTDTGWKVSYEDSKTLVSKGYADDISYDKLLSTRDQAHTGNYCIFEYNATTDTVQIFTDRWRQFTMYYTPGQSITNLVINDCPIWSDKLVTVDSNLELDITNVNLVGEFDQECSYSQVLDTTYNTLRSRVSNFLSHNQLPLKVFLSGGVDSTLVYSFIKTLTGDYEHVFKEEFEWDYFWTQNKRYIVNHFWAYKQMHHWLTPCVLSTGAPGDEFFLRNPRTLDLWLSYHGEKFSDYLKDNVRYSQKEYFEKNINKMSSDSEYQTLKSKLMDFDRAEFLTYLCNNVLNDSQHWHLGETITFTPLRDFETFKALIQLSPDDLKDHISGAQFSIDLIKRNDSSAIELLSPIKNVGESLINIYPLMKLIT